MDLQTTVLSLIDQIYDSVENPDHWSATIQAIADSVGSRMTGFSVIDPHARADSIGIYLGGDAAARQQYQDYYHKLNVHARTLPFAEGMIVNSVDWGIDEELEKSEYYQDFLRPLDSFHLLSGLVAQHESCYSIFTCYRPLSGEPFGKRATITLALIFPHLQRAVRLNQQIGLLRSTTTDFDDLASAAVLFNRESRVIRVNRRARRIIDQNDGLSLRHGETKLSANGEDELLLKLIADCCAASSGKGIHPGGVLAVRRKSGKRAYHLAVSPIRFSLLDTGSQEPAAILFLSDPEDAPQVPEQVVARLYGLSVAESRLSSLLLDGIDLTEACRRLSISRNTGRAHLRSIFDKLGVRSQSELVALLARSLLGRSSL